MMTASHTGVFRKRRSAPHRKRQTFAEPRDVLLGVVAPALLLCGWALDAAVSSAPSVETPHMRTLTAANAVARRAPPATRARKVETTTTLLIGAAKTHL